MPLVVSFIDYDRIWAALLTIAIASRPEMENTGLAFPDCDSI